MRLAAFAPDTGESPGQISEQMPPAGFDSIVPDSDGYLWIKKEDFHQVFCQALGADEALVMAVVQKAPVASTFGDAVNATTG